MTIETAIPSVPETLTPTAPRRVNWRQVGAFVALTFVLTWTLDLVLYLQGGLTNPAVGMALQLQMLLPAFSAMLLGMFFFKDSPIYLRTNRRTSRVFTWYFLVFTLIYIAAFTWVSFRPWDLMTISSFILLPSVLGMLFVIVLRIVGKKDSFAGAGMAGGLPKWWLWLGLGVLGYMLLQTGLNWLFKLGSPADLSALLGSLGATGMPDNLLLVVLTVQTVILGPFLGLLITFGEEYGWRGYLQPALTPLGRARSVLLVGVIWGVWHAPIILMGYNYPGHPVLGALLFVPVCIGLAFFLGYATLKAKGVWIAAFLHALFNQSASYFLGFIYTPRDPFYSFGAGLLSLLTLGLVVFLLLRDPLWKEKDDGNSLLVTEV